MHTSEQTSECTSCLDSLLLPLDPSLERFLAMLGGQTVLDEDAAGFYFDPHSLLVPNAAKRFLLMTGSLVTGPSVTGLNDHELVHEAEETVDEPAVENHKVAEWASWVAGFFQDVDGLEVAVALAL